MAAVRLSHRYIPGRQLPDKAVSVLDTACARLALGQNSMPPQLKMRSARLDDLAVQERVLERESAVGADHAERLRDREAERATVRRPDGIAGRFDKKKGLVRIREMRAKLEGDSATPAAAAARQPRSGELTARSAPTARRCGPSWRH